MNSSGISVVIPARNRAGLIIRAIKSAQRQIPEPHEIIVVDNGSTDATVEIAISLGANVVQETADQSVGECRNVGLRRATATWTAFLDADDEWLPGHLSRMSMLFDRFALISESAVMTPTTEDGPRVLGNAERRDVQLHHPFAVLEPENRIVTSACVVKTRFALDVGGFADGSLSEDLDLWIRCIESQPAIALGTVGAIYHRHDEQLSACTQRMREAARRYVKSYDGSDWYSPTAYRHFETRQYWDELRRSMRTAGRADTLRALTRLLGRPQDAAALMQLFQYRKRSRTRGAEEWQQLLNLGNVSATPGLSKTLEST